MERIVVRLEREQDSLLSAAVPPGVAFGDALPLLLPTLDALAERITVTPLSKLGAWPAPKKPGSEWELELDEDSTEVARRTEWFPAADGLRTIRGLLTLIRQKPALVKHPKLKSADDVLFDLEILERLLEMAHNMKIRFCLTKE